MEMLFWLVMHRRKEMDVIDVYRDGIQYASRNLTIYVLYFTKNKSTSNASVVSLYYFVLNECSHIENGTKSLFSFLFSRISMDRSSVSTLQQLKENVFVETIQDFYYYSTSKF